MNRSMSFKGLALIAAGILVVFLALHAVLSRRRNERSEQENLLRVKQARLEEENKSLNAQLNVVDTEEYIMTSAVRDYAYVKRDAIRFEFTNPDALNTYTEQEWEILTDEMVD